DRRRALAPAGARVRDARDRAGRANDGAVRSRPPLALDRRPGHRPLPRKLHRRGGSLPHARHVLRRLRPPPVDAPTLSLNTAGVPERPTFLGEPPASEATTQAYEADRESDGYVGNLTRLWSWRPDLYESFVAQRTQLMTSSALT